MTRALGAGLALSLTSACALNWGFLAQHDAGSALPPLRAHHPLKSLRALLGSRRWLVGFLAGISGWGLYVLALALAPLSLVQATSAGGIAILALLVHFGHGRRRLSRLEWSAVAPAVLGLALLGLSLRAADSGSSSTSGTLVLAWLLGSAVAAAFSASLLAPAVGLGLAAGILYAGADVATKAAVGGRMFFVLGVIAASALAFACLQLGFQRGGPLTTIGVSTLLTNALPIAAGVVVFHEAVPAGWRGGLRVAAFVLVTTAAALLVRAAADGADEPSGKVSLVRPVEPSRRKPRPEQLRRRPRIAGE